MPANAARPSKYPRSHYEGHRMSEAAYLALPLEKPWIEYIDGIVVQKYSGDWEQSLLIAEFGFLLGGFRDAHGGDAIIGLRSLDPVRRNYLVSDVGYLLPGSPAGDDVMVDLAVEVRSPDETIAAQQRKCVGWIEAGVREAWLVEPRTRTVEVFEAGGERRTLGEHEALVSNGVAGLEIDLAALFKVLDR
jgi:Uma2 family endonuclease